MYGRTTRLPVHYVFVERPLDMQRTLHAFQQRYPDHGTPVLLMSDADYQQHLGMRPLTDSFPYSLIPVLPHSLSPL